MPNDPHTPGATAPGVTFHSKSVHGKHMRSIHTSLLPAAAEQVYRWHTRPGAFERLVPPWERVQLIARDGLFETQRVELGLQIGPFRVPWTSRHHDVTPGRQFVDTQERGPFALWTHARRFEPISPRSSRLEEEIEYRLPAGAMGRMLAGRMVRGKIARMMQHRHRVLSADLAAHHGRNGRGSRMKVTVVGASGLVGSAFAPFLTSGGHDVRCVGRTKSPGRSNAFVWDYARRQIEDAALDGTDVVVNLAGENIGTRWTPAKKRAIRASRVDATRFLSERLAAMQKPPATFVCASAVGYYGDRGDEQLTESSARGSGTLAELCEAWEEATAPARARGIRVVHVRFGLVLSPRGGPLARMLPPFRLGLGGKLAHGRQFMSWVSIEDVIGILNHVLLDESLEGPVNAVAPQPLTNAEFTRTLGRVLNRPTLFPVPAFALRTLFGEMADDVLLASARVLPEKLMQSGYEFRDPDLESALRHLLGRGQAS